jgi:hypothetical protein
VAFSTDIQVERTEHADDDRMLFEMEFKLIGAAAIGVSATLETEFYENPIVLMSGNTLGLHPADEDALVIAVYGRMRHYFHVGPSSGDIWWVRWLEPDIEPWLRQSLSQPAATRIVNGLARHVDPATPPEVLRRYTESAEG